MVWDKIKTHWLFLYFTQKNNRPPVSIFTFILGGWTGMLISPPIGAFLMALSLYLVLVIYFPWDKILWNKFKFCRDYIVPAVITILIIIPFWGKLVSLFPITDPYKQPLQTATADIQIIVDSNDTFQPFGLGNMMFIKGDIDIKKINGGRAISVKNEENFFEMRTMTPLCAGRIENNKILYIARLENILFDERIGGPICDLSKAEYITIRFDNMLKKSKIIRGLAVFTFNSTLRIEIPIPAQILIDKDVVILETQKYFIAPVKIAKENHYEVHSPKIQ